MTDNTLDKEIEETLKQLADYYNRVYNAVPPQKREFTPEKAKTKLKSLILTREKKMLEFVIPRQIDQYTEVGGVSGDWIMHGYNKAIDDMSQRAKEWEKRND